MFDRTAIVRPLGRCRIVAGEVNRGGKRAARQAAPAYTRSVHVHRAAEPTSPASLAPRRTHVSTANQVAWVQFDIAASSAPRAKICLTFFRGAGNLSIHLCLYCVSFPATYAMLKRIHNLAVSFHLAFNLYIIYTHVLIPLTHALIPESLRPTSCSVRLPQSTKLGSLRFQVNSAQRLPGSRISRAAEQKPTGWGGR